MPLTAQVKQELMRHRYPTGRLRAAELASLLRFAGGLHHISGHIVIEVVLDSPELTERVRRGLAELYGAPAQLVESVGAPGEYVLRIPRGGEILARQTGMTDTRNRPVRGLPSALVNGSPEISCAVWRGAFLAAGSLSDPGRSSALEVACPVAEAAMALVGTARRVGVVTKAREIRGSHRVVVREPEAIATMLRLLGATHTLEEWEEVRHRREVRANVNRLVNFDDANLRRSAQAAVAASARVERALEILGDDIPDHLRQAGDLRLQHRQASLDELGRLADPVLTKDAVAGRIRRLLAMADRRAKELGVPGTEANVPDSVR